MTAPDPNRFAGLAEAAIIRGHLQDEEADIARLRARQQVAHSAVHDAEVAFKAAQQALSTARAIAADVDRRVDELEAGARTHRGFLHPIRRLPDEILAAIFCAYNDLGDEPYNEGFSYPESLMTVAFCSASVCRRWRSVAVQTRALWTYIIIDIERAARRPAEWLALIALVCARSVSHPIAISVMVPDDHAHNAVEICTELLRAQHRWRTLHINVGDGHGRDVQRMLTGYCPILRTVAISGRPFGLSTPEPVCFALSGPLLRSLHISHCRVSISPQLEESSIENVTVNHHSVNPRMSDLGGFAKGFPRLTTLSVIGFAKYILDGPAPITFPALRSLTLVGAVLHPPRQYFHCPQLIEATTATRQGCYYSLIFLLMSDVRVGCVSGLRKLFLREDCLGPLDDRLVLELFSQLPRLEELETAISSVKPSFFDAFSRPSGDGLWIAPRLQRLAIHVALSKKLIKAALTLVRRRSQASISDASNAPCLLSNVTLGNYEDAESGRTQEFQDAVRAVLDLV
ncbi:hypothetical protein EXIGLDRAFT_760510 [Exidia glandulosa HHB12029]|uniref:F-box domain-containing protein n=1 Tax=Exidia glandulosa HHB12029 TaxID=1314781 RepID=A0A165PAW4_EXIGL|nr:hypothetical protein EXIGLDRAFT_760510 [Exidia glandulosa HHB12029]